VFALVFGNIALNSDLAVGISGSISLRPHRSRALVLGEREPTIP
jgi:hypothetical protein